MSRIYVGRLSSRASDRDIERFFRGYGKIHDIIIKNGFGFVEFEDRRDADDAVHDLNGRDLCGERVILEFPRRKFGYNEDKGGGDRRSRDSHRRGERQFSSRYGRPCSTRFRLIIENLSTRYTWQDIKDHIRRMGIEPTYSEAHKKTMNEALICFSSHDDLRRAMDKLQGEDLNGRKLKCIDDTTESRSRSPRSRSRSGEGRSRSRTSSRSRSRSRSPPPRRSRSRSGSPKRRGDRRRSKSGDGSRTPSPPRKDENRSPYGSPSPKKRRQSPDSRSPSPRR